MGCILPREYRLLVLSFLHVFFYLSFRWTRSWWLSISILVGLTIGLTVCISHLGLLATYTH